MINRERILYKHKWIEPVLYIMPYGILWVLFLAWPVIYGIVISLFEWTGTDQYNFIGLDNYFILFREPRFWNAVFNTLTFSLIVIPFILLLSLAFSLMLWSISRKGGRSSAAQSMLFFPYLCTVSVVSLAWKWILDKEYGILSLYLKLFNLPPQQFLLNTDLVLVILAVVTAWWLSGYRMLVFLAGLEEIPEELFESAEIDGAKFSHKFFHIILPLLKPSILFTLILTIIAGFRTFGQVLVMTGGGPGRTSEVLALYIYRVGFEYFEMGKASGAGIILLLQILVLTLLGIRFIGLKSEF